MEDEGSRAIIIVTAVFLFFSLVAVSLRCFVRLKIVKAFGRDDALMVTAAILNIAFATCGIVGATNGMGKKASYLAHRPNLARRGLLCWWLGQIFYIFTCTIARLSIAVTLLRLAVERIHSWILYGVMGLSTAVGMVFLFFSIFQCEAVSCFWTRLPTGCQCVNEGILLGIVYMYSGVATLCDFTLGSLPVHMIWRVQMDRQTKLAVSGLLSIACVASTAVIVRIPFLHYASSPDFLHATTQISIWSNIEASLGITAGSLMTVRPLLRFISHAASTCPSQHSPGASVSILSDRCRNSVFKSRGERTESQSTAPTEVFLEN